MTAHIVTANLSNFIWTSFPDILRGAIDWPAMMTLTERRRKSDDDPNFPQPADRSGAVWRYMTFPKFVAMLDRGIFLARADQLGDAWEGTAPAGTKALFRGSERAVA